MELQLFLVWHNAIIHFPYIIQKLSSALKIRGVFETTWDKSTTLQKMQELYQFTIYDAKQKLIECGYGKIIIVILEDPHPATKLYSTKYGIIPVSKNAQELKEEIRNQLGNVELIHGTMLDFEFDNDIKVCLESTKAKFIKKYSADWDGTIWKV